MDTRKILSAFIVTCQLSAFLGQSDIQTHQRNRQIAPKSLAVAGFFVDVQMVKGRLAVQTRQHVSNFTGDHLQVPATFAQRPIKVAQTIQQKTVVLQRLGSTIYRHSTGPRYSACIKGWWSSMRKSRLNQTTLYCSCMVMIGVKPLLIC